MLIYYFSLLVSILSSNVFRAYAQEDGSSFAVKHSWSKPPTNWLIHSNPSPNDTLKLHIGLKQNHLDAIKDHILEVSDPDNDRYGNHLSRSALNELIAPSKQTVDAVDEWLKGNNIDISTCQRSEAGDWLHVEVPLSQVEMMLQTQYHIFRHNETGESVIRTLSYSLPEHLHEHVDIVAPTTGFTRSRRPPPMKRSPQAPPTTTPTPPATLRSISRVCNAKAITPECLRTLYGTINYVPSATDQNQIGITGYLDGFASQADLTTFMEDFRPEGKDARFDIIQINGGGNNQSDPGLEANVDIQLTVVMTYPTDNVFYSTGGFALTIPDDSVPPDSNEPYLDWLHFILHQGDIPQVITNSYGDTEQTVPRDYATRVCNEFAKLAALGTSVLFGSGDTGVAGFADECRTNDGSNIAHFQPIFPASCPWVTTVGGTAGINPERAASFSGGGFSNYFPRPAWQKPAVDRFLNQLGNKYEGLYNSSGRSYPDVSTHAENAPAVVNGEIFGVDGTSISTPIFASVIALVNDYRLSQGKTALGFLNPLLYKYPHLLTDITTGNNPGCGTEGFNATHGWDPVTGLGTPNFKQFQKLEL